MSLQHLWWVHVAQVLQDPHCHLVLVVQSPKLLSVPVSLIAPSTKSGGRDHKTGQNIKKTPQSTLYLPTSLKGWRDKINLQSVKELGSRLCRRVPKIWTQLLSAGKASPYFKHTDIFKISRILISNFDALLLPIHCVFPHVVGKVTRKTIKCSVAQGACKVCSTKSVFTCFSLLYMSFVLFEGYVFETPKRYSQLEKKSAGLGWE